MGHGTWCRGIGLYSVPSVHTGGDLAPSFGGRKNLRRPRFLRPNDVFLGKNSIFMPKIFDDLFLVIDYVFDFPYLYCVKCQYDPFLHEENHYFGK